MDMEIYVFCLKFSEYLLLKETIVSYIKECMGESVSYGKEFINDDDFIETVGCKLFQLYIESQFTSKELDLDYTIEEYHIRTNVQIYTNLFSDTMNEGIYALKELIKRLAALGYTNILVENDSSKVVYIYSENEMYTDDKFWNP